MSWLDDVKWGADGLVPAIAQEVGTNDVLMFAHMNREALARTAELGEAVYWSRSRGRLWHKGEASGNVQKVHELRLDCGSFRRCFISSKRIFSTPFTITSRRAMASIWR